MQHIEKVIGFDLRVNGDEEDAEWSAARRDQYLLRPDVKRPLSTDVWVWGSVMSPDHSRELSPDLDALARSALAAPPPTPWIVALTILIEPGHTDAEVAWGEAIAYLQGAFPLPSGWLLGYDVSDSFLLSGLSNCGYSPHEIEALKQHFLPRLNRFHLFDDPEHALAFKAETNKRVSEHSPFFVYGLYRVPSSS